MSPSRGLGGAGSGAAAGGAAAAWRARRPRRTRGRPAGPRLGEGKMAAGPAGKAVGARGGDALAARPPARSMVSLPGAILGWWPGAPERDKMAEGGGAARPGPCRCAPAGTSFPAGAASSLPRPWRGTDCGGAGRPLPAATAAPVGGQEAAGSAPPCLPRQRWRCTALQPPPRSQPGCGGLGWCRGASSSVRQPG